MAKKKIVQDPSILEAVDNLSSMAELDIEEIKADQKDNGTMRVNTMRWLDAVDEKKTIDAVKANIKVVSNYLKHIHKKDSAQLKDKGVQKGVAAIMNLAQEAVDKVDDYAKQCKKKISIKNSKEYVALIEFYEKRIKSRFTPESKSDDSDDEEEETEENSADIKRRGLKDLESVTRDNDYELFFLQKENGGRFYNANLARHIRLVADFDQIISNFSDFDPLTRVPLLKDDIAYHLCKELKNRLKSELDGILKAAGKYRDDPLVQNVFRATMALLLASNAKNQLKITTGKSVSGYFKDFQSNIRSALSSIDYRNYIDNPPEEEFYVKLLDLLHMLCYVIYTAHINTDEAGALIASMIGTGKDKKTEKKSRRSSTALWNTLLDDYDILSAIFSKCPNGPLFKVLDILKEGEAFAEFDPLLLGDFPGNYFSLKTGEKKMSFLKIPSPTMQTNIDVANLSFEFTGFIRALLLTQKNLLLFNFQDRTSWKEYSRAHVIENASIDPELSMAITVVTLPKSTDFYNQSDDYLKIEDAKDFKSIFIKQLEGGEDCGYYFPMQMNKAEFITFSKKMIDEVHAVFFGDKKNLSRKNRLDFIEIVYHMIYLFFIQKQNPDFVSFSAKDGVDVTSTAVSSMFAFLKSISGELEWKVEDEDFMIEMIYSSALIVRERVTQFAKVNRAVSMLAVITGELELDKKKIAKSLKNLYGDTFKAIDIQRYVA
ncbi:MAG: hypothetical protein SP4CHLAM5_03160 [Chlamydiia bacterium]|nr:hypothetical protein [Chlamydiia bacterium]MCH9618190.1 hypothetical protein [Chlamydiia bacterium]MCH9624087.1 hypothetical protein [Chlamydiia bacterium]